MWLYNQRVIYICICLCSDNCFRTDQTRLGYYDVTARLTLMIDLLSLLFINDLKDWFVSANYILWFTVGCRWSLFEIWRIECKQKGSKLNCYLVPPYISVKFDWGLGVSVVCTALRSDSDPCFFCCHSRFFQTEVAEVYVFKFIKYLIYNSDKKYKLILINIKLINLKFEY